MGRLTRGPLTFGVLEFGLPMSKGLTNSMKIKRNTPDVFIAEEVPWLIAVMLVIFVFAFVAPGLGMAFDGVWQGFLFALFGGGMGFAALCVFVERLQVILDRREGLITLRRRTILKYEQKRLPLEALSRAEIQTTTSHKDGRTRQLYRPALVLLESDVETTYPVTQVFSSDGRSDRLVNAINLWIGQA